MNGPKMTDAQLAEAFEACELTPATFRHREHLRLAYHYLTRQPLEVAHGTFKKGLLRMPAHVGAPSSHYHATMTRAWLHAVDHFMHRVGRREDSEHFLAACACLLDREIMHTHYTPALLHSAAARESFVEPDLDPIPGLN